MRTGLGNVINNDHEHTIDQISGLEIFSFKGEISGILNIPFAYAGEISGLLNSKQNNITTNLNLTDSDGVVFDITISGDTIQIARL